MTMKHIEDQVQRLCMSVAKDALIMGMTLAAETLKDTKGSKDNTYDALEELVKAKMEGK